MPRKPGLSASQKLEVVLKLLRREEPAKKLARRYGISEATLYRYRDIFLEGGKTGLQGSSSAKAEQERIKDLKRQIAERDQVIGEITIANRILKKLQDGEL